MSGGERGGRATDGDQSETDWPTAFRGITESVVTTLGPNDLWNVAALGLHPPDGDGDRDSDAPVTARTWGNTRTRRNFHRRGGGYVQFVRDPVLFVDAALSVREVDEPVVEAADAWIRVDVERIDAGESGDTRWEEWALRPVDAGVERETVPTIDRGFNAVVEATVAASRLGVAAYDQSALRDRLRYFDEVGRNCGGERVRAALDRLAEALDEPIR
ncbi:DUF447 domain-containing protein [Halobacteriales archaeon QS_1_67_19]|nr:MAG: DUF447 domain-containing protein [Halobacteriales archaeon QS_1_67_19]